MVKIINDKPSSFFSQYPVKVLDEKKNTFYRHPNDEGQITFNLPKGKYYCLNPVTRLKVFKPYTRFNHPFEKDFLDGLKIRTGKNPNKATIYRSQKFVLLDEKISECNYKPLIVFTIAHEVGHSIYFPANEQQRNNADYMQEIEKLCDGFARDYMLSYGYNPNQVRISKNLLISGHERRNCLEENLSVRR